MSASVAAFLIRPRRSSATLTWLQVLASGVSTLLAFAVAMLAIAYWNAPTDESGYVVLAVSLVGLLIVPLATLGSAAARLAARSRDDRLATLRLLGATSARVRRIAVAEVTYIAAVGVLIGAALSAALPFVLSLLTVYGRPLDPSELWLPWWLAASLPPLLVGVAAVSGVIGLHQVSLSPLGVRTRQNAPRLSWLRLVAAMTVLGVAVLVTQTASDAWGTVVVIIVLSVAVVAVMAILGLVGPLLVSRVAGARTRRTSDPGHLIAARGIIDDPRTAWREVSALALATFILIPSGSMLGYLNAIQNSASREIMTSDQLRLFADARTMVIGLVAMSFLVVACQIAITQTAAVIERRDLSVALDRIGMPRRQLNRARRLRVSMPANIAVFGSMLAAIFVASWVVVTALMTAPLFILAIIIVLVAGRLLIQLGVAATTPVLNRVLAAPTRGE